MPPRKTATRPRQRPIRPRTAGVTAEAAQALDIPEGVGASDSAADSTPVYDPSVDGSVSWYGGMTDPSGENTVPDISELGDVGSVIDGEIGSQSADKSGNPSDSENSQVGARGDMAPSAATARKRRAKTEPDDTGPLIDPEKLQRDKLKTGPPDATEWLDFFSRIVLKVGMNSYIDLMFRDIDEERVTDADLAKIKVSKEERDAIARPLAEYATKNPYTRKHGRQVVALTDSIESLMTLGIWMRRVNRVAKKYRPVKPKTIRASAVHIREASTSESNGSPSANGVGGTQGGYIRPDYGPIINPGSG